MSFHDKIPIFLGKLKIFKTTDFNCSKDKKYTYRKLHTKSKSLFSSFANDFLYSVLF